MSALYDDSFYKDRHRKTEYAAWEHDYILQRLTIIEAEGFKFYDAVRPFVWNDPKIPVWYRQNVVQFSKLDFPTLKEVSTEQVDIIHPKILKRHMEDYEKYGKTFPLPFPE